MSKNDSPEFAFFYLLSLVALVMMAISTGTIVFQIINQAITDVVESYSGRYSDSAMKFAISALIIFAPIYYVTTGVIQKAIRRQELDKDSAVRRWLTYFILFAASVVMLGWLVAIINNFMEGELTSKFFLKALTAIIIAGTACSLYLYDIIRPKPGKSGQVIRMCFYISLLAVMSVCVSS